MIDLHAHLLPGIDDGARDLPESLAMLCLAADDGIERIVATPHAHHSHGVDIRAAVLALNAEARAVGLPVTILPGSEVRIASGLIERFRAGELLTLNDTRYLLLELPLLDEWPERQLLSVLDALLAAGLVPVLAHAERYRFVERDPSRLAPLIECGIPVQVTARSLLYRREDPERIAAETLLRLGYAHLLASDAHNAGFRSPVLRSAFDRAAELAGPTWVSSACSLASAIVADEALRVPVPEPRD